MLTPVIETGKWYIGKVGEKLVVFNDNNTPSGIIKESIIPLKQVKNAITNIKSELSKGKTTTNSSILNCVTEYVQPYLEADVKKNKIIYNGCEHSFSTSITLEGPEIVVDDDGDDDSRFDLSDPDVFKKVGLHIIGLYLTHIANDFFENVISNSYFTSRLLIYRLMMTLLEDPEPILSSDGECSYQGGMAKDLRLFKELYNKVWGKEIFKVNTICSIVVTDVDYRVDMYGSRSHFGGPLSEYTNRDHIKDFKEILEMISDLIPDETIKKKIKALKFNEPSIRELLNITKSTGLFDVFILGDKWKGQ
jgi:hypothetical protein